MSNQKYHNNSHMFCKKSEKPSHLVSLILVISEIWKQRLFSSPERTWSKWGTLASPKCSPHDKVAYLYRTYSSQEGIELKHQVRLTLITPAVVPKWCTLLEIIFWNNFAGLNMWCAPNWMRHTLRSRGTVEPRTVVLRN